MHNILVLLKNNIKIMIFDNLINYIIGMIIPIVILIVAASIFGSNNGNMNIGVIDNDNSKTSLAIINSIKSNDRINIVYLNHNNFLDSLNNKSVDSVIEFPASYEEDIINLKDPKINISKISDPKLEKALLENEVYNIKSLAKVCNKNKQLYDNSLNSYTESNKNAVNKKELSDLSTTYTLGSLFIGFLVLFMLNRGMSNATHYFNEKSSNVFNRIFVAPIKTYEYYVADVLSSYMTILLQITISLLGLKLMNYNFGISITYIFLIFAVLILPAIALAMLIRSFSETEAKANLIYNFFMIFLVMLSGCFVPFEMMPDIFQKISYFSPVRWAMKAISDIQSGYALIDILKYMLIIILFATAFFVLAAYKTSKEDKKYSI